MYVEQESARISLHLDNPVATKKIIFRDLIK